MRVFLTTVAGSATRFSESVGKPTVKCIYNREDPKKTLLNHMLTQASDYDCFVVVGGFFISELKAYINDILSEEFRSKILLVNNEQYAEFGSGWSLYLGIKAVIDKYGSSFDELLFAEGDLFVDDEMVATYHGDGVIISTPTGSTAYSLSAGGPVVAPTCACFVITPIAPHNLTMRPVVIPDTSRIRLEVQARRSEAFLTLDNRSYAVPSSCSFSLRKADKSIFLAVPHNISFYDTLRNKMMWGVDIRS